MPEYLTEADLIQEPQQAFLTEADLVAPVAKVKGKKVAPKKPAKPTLGKLKKQAAAFETPFAQTQTQEGYEFQVEGAPSQVELKVKPLTDLDYKKPMFELGQTKAEAPKLKPIKARRRLDESAEDFTLREAQFEDYKKKSKIAEQQQRAEVIRKTAPKLGLEKYPIAMAEGVSNVLRPIASAAEQASGTGTDYFAYYNQMPKIGQQEADEWGVKVAEGLGSTIPFGIASALGGMPATVIMGAASNSASTYEDAKMRGASDDAALAAAVPGAVIGSLEGLFGLGTGRFMKEIGKGGIKTLFGGVAEEELQELTSQALNNVNAKWLSGYDPQRALSEGLWETFTTTLGTAGLMHGAGAASGIAARLSDPKLKADEALQALPEPDRKAVQFASLSPDPNSFKGLTPKQREAALLNWQLEADPRLKTPEGQPVPLYHGTQSPTVIEEIDLSKADPNGLYGPGFYMTQDPEVAAGEGGYAQTKSSQVREFDKYTDEELRKTPEYREAYNMYAEAYPEALRSDSEFSFEESIDQSALNDLRARTISNPHAYKLYANIKKPFDVDKIFSPEDLISLVKSAKVMGMKSYMADFFLYKAKVDGFMRGQEIYDWLQSGLGSKETVNNFLRGEGYDGITHIGGVYKDRQHRVWIAFDPAQVKSAWAKEFDPGSTKIEAAELDSGPQPQEAKSPSFRFTQPAARFYEGRDQRGGTVYVNPQMAAKLADWPATAGAVNVETKEFGRMLARLDKNDPQAKVLEEAFVEAIKKDQPSVNIVIYSEGTGMWARRLARHEGFHRGQYLASREALKAEGKEGLFQPDIGTIHDPALHDHPVVQRVANSPIGESIKSHYADSYVPAALTFETAAYMASNDFRRFGVSADEAALFVRDYLKSVANKSGVKGLQALVDGTRLIPSIEQAAKEIISGRTEQPIRTGRSGADIPGRLGGTVDEFAESGTVGSGDRGDGGTGVQAEAGTPTNELAPGPGKPFWGRPRRGLGKTALLSNAPDMRYVPDAQGKGGALYANPKAMATYFNLNMSHPNHVDMRGVALNVDGIGIMAGLAEKSGKALAPVLRAFHTDLVNKGAEKGFVAIHRPGSKVERDVLYHEDAHIAQSKFKTEEWREVWNRMKGDEGWEKALNSPYGKAIKEYGTTRGWNEENPSSEQIEQVVKELEAYLIMGGPGQANIRKGLGMSEEEVGNMLTRLHATLKEVAGTERVEEAYSGIHLRPGTKVFMYPSFSTPEPPNIYTTVLSSDAVKEIANKAGQVLKVLGIPENPLLRPHEQIMQALKDYPDKATPEAMGAAMRQLGLDGKDLVEAVDEASRHAGQLLRNLQDANAKWTKSIKDDPKWATEAAKTGAHILGLGPSPKEVLKEGLASLEASELGRTWWQRSGDLYRKMLLSRFSTAAVNSITTTFRLPLDLLDGAMTGAAMGALNPAKYAGKPDATVAEAAKEGAIAGAHATMRVAMAFPDMAKKLLRKPTPEMDTNDLIISQMENLHPELHTKLTGLSTGLDIIKESKAKIEDLKSLLPYLNDSEKQKEYEARLNILQKRYDQNNSMLGKMFNKTGWMYDQYIKPSTVQEFFFRRPYFVGALVKRAKDAGFDLYSLIENTKRIEDFSKDPTGQDVNEVLNLQTLANLPPEVWEGAADDALTFTYAYKPKKDRGVVENLYATWIESMQKLGLAGAIIDAFPKATYNGLKFAYEYSPFGMLKPAINIASDAREGGRTAIQADDVSRMVKGGLGMAMFATALYIRKEHGGEEWYQIKTGKKDKKGQPIYMNVKKYMPFAGMLYLADVSLRAKEGRLFEVKTHGDDMAELYLNARRADSGGAAFFDLTKEMLDWVDTGAPIKDKTKAAAARPLANVLGAPLTPLVNLRDMVAQFDEDEAARRDQKEAPILGPAIDKIPWLRSSEKFGLPLTQPPTEQAPRPFSAAPGLTWFGVNLDPGSNFATREFARLGLSPIRWLKPDPDPIINRAQYAAYSKKLAAISPKIEASPLYQKKTDAQKAAFWEAKLAGPDGIAAEARELGKQANPKEINKREILQSQPPLMRKATGLDKKVNAVKNASDNK